MAEIEFILPKDNGFETPFGEVYRYSCNDSDPISSLFGVIRRQFGKENVQLSLQSRQGNVAVLLAIDPQSQKTLAAAGYTRARILVGFRSPR